MSRHDIDTSWKIILSLLFLKHRLLLTIFLLLAGNTLLLGDALEDTLTTNTPSFMENINGTFFSGWESHYYSEGRDNLDGDSLIVTDFQLSWELLTTEVWYAASPDQSYDELQAILLVSQSFEDLGFCVSYTHLQFPSDNLKDNEVGVGLVIMNLPAELQLLADAYYSFDADGSFAEISAVRQFAFTESLNIAGVGIFGMNQGYIADGHDGSNHFALRLESTYAISDSVSLTAQLTQSWEMKYWSIFFMEV